VFLIVAGASSLTLGAHFVIAYFAVRQFGPAVAQISASIVLALFTSWLKYHRLRASTVDLFSMFPEFIRKQNCRPLPNHAEYNSIIHDAVASTNDLLA
jgi:hypothetical protein